MSGNVSDTKAHLRATVNYIFELAQLREKSRSGWELIKVPDKEKVASHVLRMTHLAYIIAVMEGVSEPEKVACGAVFHENNETRAPDLNRLARRYVKVVDNEAIVAEQTVGMGKAGEDILTYWQEVENRSSPGAVIVKDADYLECAFTAKEYEEQGHKFAEDWIRNVRSALVTVSAVAIFDQMITMTSNDWWQGLKKFP